MYSRSGASNCSSLHVLALTFRCTTNNRWYRVYLQRGASDRACSDDVRRIRLRNGCDCVRDRREQFGNVWAYFHFHHLSAAFVQWRAQEMSRGSSDDYSDNSDMLYKIGCFNICSKAVIILFHSTVPVYCESHLNLKFLKPSKMLFNVDSSSLFEE